MYHFSKYISLCKFEFLSSDVYTFCHFYFETISFNWYIVTIFMYLHIKLSWTRPIYSIITANDGLNDAYTFDNHITKDIILTVM